MAVDPRDTLRAYIAVQQATDRKVLALLRQARRDLDLDLADLKRAGKNETVRADQARLARAAVLERTAQIIRQTGDIVAAAKLDAAAAADRELLAYDRVLMAGALNDEQVRAYLNSAVEASRSAVALAERRLQGRGYVPLSEQVYKTGTVAAGIVDSAVNSAIARGLSAREFAAEVIGLVDPATPGGASYAAMRLARTELNNAFHARAIDQARESPWTAGMRWTLSGSHPRPDQCNDYADYDDGHGIGVFAVDDVPAKPHPHCLCIVTPVNEFDYNQPNTGRGKGKDSGYGPTRGAEDEWLDHFFAGDYDDYIQGRIDGARGLKPPKSFYTS